MFGGNNNLTKDLVVYNKNQKAMLLELIRDFCGTISCDVISHNNYSITYRVVSIYDVNYYSFLRDFFDELKYNNKLKK